MAEVMQMLDPYEELAKANKAIEDIKAVFVPALERLFYWLIRVLKH